MANAPRQPSSNKKDRALSGPNVDRDDTRSTSASRTGGASRDSGRGGSARSGAPSSLHDIDEAGTGLTDQDAGTSMHGSGSGTRGAASAGGRQGAASRGRGDGSTRQGSSGMGRSSAGNECVGDVMTRNVCLANPDQTIREAAEMMADADVGSLPVGENDRLVGMITDRDIVLRAVAEGRDANTSVREVMTDRIQYCFEDESVDQVARNMAELGVRRLPVVNRDKRLVGILALSNITHCGDSSAKETFLDSVATPH